MTNVHYLLTAALLLILLVVGYGLYYWLIIVTEGVFFGRRFVVWLYNVTAARYEEIKRYSLAEEQVLLLEPLLEELATMNASAEPLLVDVATGTGRVPYFLGLDQRYIHEHHGRVIGIEPAWQMLAVAQRQCATLSAPEQRQILFVQQYAERLPLPTAVAEIVTCLEALEFMSDPDTAVAELVRILKPGGVLFLTRRHGREAHFFLHRYRSAAQVRKQLAQLGLTDINEIVWEIDYNLFIARKPSTR